MYSHRDNSARQGVEIETAVYEKLLAQYAQIMYAYTEGVFEVTIRSQSEAITVPVSFAVGSGVAAEIADFFIKHISSVERNLNTAIEELAIEERPEVQQLAQRAATTAVPKQPVGRPKRKVATPQPQVMEMVGQAASMVPMNATTFTPTSQTGAGPQA